jgi:hypothetical protein
MIAEIHAIGATVAIVVTAAAFGEMPLMLLWSHRTYCFIGQR